MRRVIVSVLIAAALAACGKSEAPQPAAPAATTPPAATAKSAPATPPASSTPKERVDFDTQLKPIFQSKCMPCHFSGGQMYDRLPFDKPATIRKLGTKLFTRIKDEHDRKLIEDFLTQTP